MFKVQGSGSPLRARRRRQRVSQLRVEGLGSGFPVLGCGVLVFGSELSVLCLEFVVEG